MPRYMIVRTFDVVEEQMPAVGRRSRSLVDTEFPEITWEHSHIVVDPTGKVRSFCVYAAPDVATVEAHSSRLGQHAIDSIDEIAGDVTPADFPAV
ncbi:MAG TPA: nickel-binding protein [Gaiellaceae bacterium]